MVINENNTQINTFTGGMNTDMSYDNLLTSQYLYGENIRITKAGQDVTVNDANVVDGVVTPVMILLIFKTKLQQEHLLGDMYDVSIIGSAMLDNMGAIIVRYTEDDRSYDETENPYHWAIFKVVKDANDISVIKFYTSLSTIPSEVTSVSVVINKETDDVLKLYIADGQDSVFSINLNDNPIYNIEEKYYRAGKIVLTKPAIIGEKVQGRLKTSQIQYIYRYYKKYGNTSRLSPITRKIQVIDTNRNKETGNAEDTETSIGFSLKIPSLSDNNLLDHYYDKMLVFRIQYIKVGNPAEVHLIYDDDIRETVIDDGIKSLLKYSIDEFGGLEGLLYIPKNIEQNQNYLFTSNVKDKSIYDISLENIDATVQYCVAKVKDNHTLSEVNLFDPETDANIYDLQGWESQLQPIDSLKSYFKSVGLSEEESSKSYVNAYNDYRFSSFLRSLRRGETYKYGIIIYYEDGSRSEVKPLNDLSIPDINIIPVILRERDTINDPEIGYTLSVGANISISYTPTNDKKPIYFQVVRQEITRNNQNTVLQCILSRPVYQRMPDDSDSPLYPTGYITTQPLVYDGDSVPYSASYSHYGPQPQTDLDKIMIDGGKGRLWELDIQNNGFGFAAGKYINKDIFQIFSPEINVFREDVLSELTSGSAELNLCNILYHATLTRNNDNYVGQDIYSEYDNSLVALDPEDVNNVVASEIITEGNSTTTTYAYYDLLNLAHGYNRRVVENDGANLYFYTKYIISNFKQSYLPWDVEKKWYEHLWNNQEPTTAVRYFLNKQNVHSKTIGERQLNTSKLPISVIKDVKNPSWNEGYTNIQISGKKIIGGNKAYKSFTTSIGDKTYLNWVCSSEYDLLIYNSTQPYVRDDSARIFVSEDSAGNGNNRIESVGWLGPGPICMLIKLDYSGVNLTGHILLYLTDDIEEDSGSSTLFMCTYLCNITHTTKTIDENQATYYGFGNFGKLNKEENSNLYTGSIYVFDGDIYPTMAELHGMYQTYNFNSIYRIPSAQTVYYAPMETRVNPFFDYGMNYRNALNDHMMIEPGSITGVISQERPVFLYNPIYSDNGTSADVYTINSDLDINEFPNRIVYSLLKTPGEKIDSWSVFKPLDYIDTDSRYGQINHMQSWKDQLFFWQTNGFGRITVNERSLVSDQNDNQIQLGTGGVLQRADYLSTMYGMREYDRASCQNDHGLFWIDVNNKAILRYENKVRQQGPVVENYGEAKSVQNIINLKLKNIGSRRVNIYYDKYNSELLCKIFPENILVFNLKYNVATSIYTKQEDAVLNFNEYLVDANIEDNYIKLHKINNILINDTFNYLLPTKLSFLVNKNALITKVFDNLKIASAIMNKSWSNNFFNKKQMSFTTDIVTKQIKNPDGYTDREGNLLYSIPREQKEENQNFGYRIRGRWMLVDLLDNEPNRLFAISHVITKFRQSFS